ncbi:hypothetical protein BJ742DRAFT_408370 [Cladochytrium replicatum]|nr:hypothetical protein BJ742DRAFT_408370 [Cladochytrium replicatum]
MASVLAPELLVQVFGHLDTAGQLAVAGQANQLWSRVSNDDSLWLKFCLNAGIEVPLQPDVLVRHVALLMVAMQQSLVQTPDTFLDMTALPFNENLLWKLCRETLEAAGSSFPFDDNGSLLEVSARSPRGVSRDTTRSSSVDSSRWSESSYSLSESSSRGSSRGRSPHVSKRPPPVHHRSHCWKLLQLPLLVDFAPEVHLTLPTGMPQLRVLYSSYATLYRGFWDVYPRIKHLSRRLEKWLFRHLPEAFDSLTFPGMGWRAVQGCSPAIKKRRVNHTDEAARRRLSQVSPYLYISPTDGARSEASGSCRMHVDGDGADRGNEGWIRDGDHSISTSNSTLPSPSSVLLMSPNETTPISESFDKGPSPLREALSDIVEQRMGYVVPLSRDANRPVQQIPSVVLVGDGTAASSVTQVLIGMHARSLSTNLNTTSESINMDVTADETPASKRLRFAPDVIYDASSAEMDQWNADKVTRDDVGPEFTTKRLGAPMTHSSRASVADDMQVEDRVETDPMTFEDGDSDSEVLTNVEEDESMEDAVETKSRSRATHSRRHLKEKYWDDYTTAQRADSYETFFDEKVWTFGKFQFMPKRASRSLKELVLFYHLFRDGQRHPGLSPFGLFGAYLCYGMTKGC